MAKEFIITAFDIGSSSIKGATAIKKSQEENPEILSLKEIESWGIRKGVVFNPQAVTEKLLSIKEELEKDTHRKIKEAIININGHHIFTKVGKGAVAISRADQKISQDDIDRVIEEAKKISLPFNKEILTSSAKEFIVDGERGIKDPLDLKGLKLEAEVLNICVFSPYLNNLSQAVLDTEIDISQIIPSPLAASQAVLSSKKKELGSLIIDIGAATTGIAVFEEGFLIHLAILPIGSENISNDIAIVLQTDIQIARMIKEKFGTYIFKSSNKKEKIVYRGETFIFPVKKFSKVAKARIEETFDLIKKELKKIAKDEALPGGAVITGGGAKIPGLVDFARKKLGLPVQIGKPKGITGLGQDPKFSTITGLILKDAEEKKIVRGGWWEKIKKIFQIFTPEL